MKFVLKILSIVFATLILSAFSKKGPSIAGEPEDTISFRDGSNPSC